MHFKSTFLLTIVVLSSVFTAYFKYSVPFAHAEDMCPVTANSSAASDFASISQGLLQENALNLSVNWGSLQIVGDATTSLPLNTPGSLQIQYSPSGSGLIGSASESASSTISAPQSLDTVLDSSQLTVSLYKGVIGSSTLVYSQPVTEGSPISIPTTFSSEGSYILAFTATDSGNTNSLQDFEEFMTNGLEENGSGELGNFIPAAYGLLPFTISRSDSSSSTASTSPTGTGASNVLFIPGMLTSRLYMKNPDGSERDLWEPRSDLDVEPLTMNADGTSKNLIYTRDIIDQLYSNNYLYHTLVKAVGTNMDVYGLFDSYMNTLVENGTIKEWRSYPYDWRFDVQDIVANGTLVGTATSSPSIIRIQDVVQQLASTSPTGKVTIIAHSDGGLIAKALAIDLQKKGELGMIDKIILIGTPQYGTPKTITDLLHGDEFTQALGLIMYSDTVRSAEATMPGAYDLLPSPAYLSHVYTPIVAFDTAEPAKEFHDAIGAVITYFSQLSDFLTDAFHLDAGAGLQGSTNTPIPLSGAIIQKIEATHAVLDAWVPPPGLEVIALAGWGNLTPLQESDTGKSGVNCARTSFFVPIACSLLAQLEPSEVGSMDGDDTVVSESAAGNISNVLYLDLYELEKQTGKIIGHSSLLSASTTQEFISSVLAGSSTTSAFISATMPKEAQMPLVVISAHSPVNLIATDESGNKTGIVPLDIESMPGIYFQKKDIPGSSVQITGENKYIYLPLGEKYYVQMQGYDTGTTTVDVDLLSSSGNLTHLQDFQDIPTTASTSIPFTVSPDGTMSSDVSLSETPSDTGKFTDGGNIYLASSQGSSKPQIIHQLSSSTESKNTFIFTENTKQLGTSIPEKIQAFITIITNQFDWIMYSTIFITILHKI